MRMLHEMMGKKPLKSPDKIKKRDNVQKYMEEEKEKVEKKFYLFIYFLSRLCLYDNFFS